MKMSRDVEIEMRRSVVLGKITELYVCGIGPMLLVPNHHIADFRLQTSLK